MDKLLFNESISSLKLNQGWFAEIPRDFLYLACSRHVVPKKEFVDKYGTDSHQSLEFYGDKVLSMIGTMIIFQMYGLKITPGQATQIYSSFSSNEALLDLAEHENFCQNLVKGIKCKYSRPTSKHNVCSDSLEAVIGAIYIYGMSTSNIFVIDEIYKWFTSFDFVLSHLSTVSGITIEALKEILDLEDHPIDWDVNINMENKKWWKNCSKNVKTPVKQIKKETKISIVKGTSESNQEFLKRLERVYETKSVTEVEDDNSLVVYIELPVGTLRGISPKGDYEEAIVNLIQEINKYV